MCDRIVVRLPQETFTRKNLGNVDQQCTEDECATGKSIQGTPIIVNFRRFNKLDTSTEEVPGIKNEHLMHAVAALYDQALTDVTDDIIYATINEKWARTILIVQDPDEALESFKRRALCNQSNCKTSLGSVQTCHDGKEGDEHPLSERNLSDQPSILCGDMSLSFCDKNDSSNATAAPAQSSRFSSIFSDMDTSDEDEEEEEEDDLTEGVESFLQDLRERKHKKELWLNAIERNNCAGEPTDLIGIEHRLVGCLTFDRVYPKPGHKVIHITLLAVRKRFRKMFVGKCLTDLVRNPLISGKYDAILVNADHRATEFFEKQGFSGDVILNSKYEEIGDTWYNCKRMCYLPPYQSLHDMDVSSCSLENAISYFDELNTLDLKQMELDYMLSHEKSLQAFQCQASIMERLRKEVLLLRAKVSDQQDTIEALKMENYAVREDKFRCEKEFLNLKLKFLMNAMDESTLSDSISNGVGGEKDNGAAS